MADRLVRIAVQPALAGFARRNYRMIGGAGVFRCMPVGRVVTTTRAPTFLARAQMHPSRTNLHAVLTLRALRMFHAGNCLEMGTSLIRHRVLYWRITVMDKRRADVSVGKTRSGREM